MNSHTYIVPGTPQFVRRYENRNRPVFDAYKEARTYFAIKLDSIHNEKCFLQGPLHLDVTFFFKIPDTSTEHQQRLKNSFFLQKPKTTKLIEFVEEVALGIIFQNEFNIVSLSAQKRYDYSPRTEFTLIEIKNDKEAKNR